MTWRDDLLEAELDGVPFLYTEISGEGGRRTELFQYPGGLSPYVEDLGPEAKVYNIAAFVIGENYHTRRQELEDVLNRGGPLPFQHPYRGLLRVKLHGKYTVTESDTEGGMARFSFVLVEAGNGFPTVFIATPAKVTALAATAADTVASKTKFSLVGAIQDVVQSVLNGFGKCTSGLRKINGKIGAALSLVDDVSFAIQSFDDQLELLQSQPQLLMNKFIALKSSLMGLVKTFEASPGPLDVIAPKFDPVRVALESFRSMNEFETEASAIPTPTDQFRQEDIAHSEIMVADRAGSLIYAADTLASLEMENSTQAAAVQKELAEAFDSFLQTEDLDPAIVESMLALKAATIEHLSAKQTRLPDLASYPVMKTQPALIVAYELYGDARRVDEIVDRNKIRHPGFTPGGQDLEVLATDD